MLFGKTFSAAFVSISMLAGVQAYHGRATWYYDGAGACGGWNVNSDYIVALAPAEYYGGGGRCNRIIRIHYQGRMVIAKVVDLCPECPPSAIDLSLSAFQALAPLERGVIQVDWEFIY